MNPSLPIEVEKLLRWLVDNGFEIELQEQGLSFGELMLELRRGVVTVRLGRDRDGWYLQIGLYGGSLYDVAVWRAHLDGGSAGTTPPFNEAIAFVHQHLDEVEQALTEDPDVARSLSVLGTNRAKAALDLDRGTRESENR